MRKELLIETLAAIKQKPEAFDMDHWVANSGKAVLGRLELVETVLSDPGRGTTMCLAGWICHTARKQGYEWPKAGGGLPYPIDDAACHFLELDRASTETMGRVFFCTDIRTFEQLTQKLWIKNFLEDQEYYSLTA